MLTLAAFGANFLTKEIRYPDILLQEGRGSQMEGIEAIFGTGNINHKQWERVGGYGGRRKKKKNHHPHSSSPAWLLFDVPCPVSCVPCPLFCVFNRGRFFSSIIVSLSCLSVIVWWCRTDVQRSRSYVEYLPVPVESGGRDRRLRAL